MPYSKSFAFDHTFKVLYHCPQGMSLGAHGAYISTFWREASAALHKVYY